MSRLVKENAPLWETREEFERALANARALIPERVHTIQAGVERAAVWATRFLALNAIWSVMGIGADIFQRLQILALASENPPTEAALVLSDTLQSASTWGGVGLKLVTAVPFLVWHWRAVGACVSLQIREYEETPGTAVSWWFVPFANLWTPAMSIFNLSKASDVRSLGTPWKECIGDPIIVVWWLGWLAVSAGSRANAFGFKALAGDTDKAQVVVGRLLELNAGSFALSIGNGAVAILAILVVRGITDRQRERTRFALKLAATPSAADQNGGRPHTTAQNVVDWDLEPLPEAPQSSSAISDNVASSPEVEEKQPATQATVSPDRTVSDIETLVRLYEQGHLTQEEFDKAKRRALGLL